MAGCDRLTISPNLLEELSAENGTLERKLVPETAASAAVEKIEMNERTFRWLQNEDAMATEKLAEGIRKFNQDTVTLKNLIREWIS